MALSSVDDLRQEEIVGPVGLQNSMHQGLGDPELDGDGPVTEVLYGGRLDDAAVSLR